MTCNQAEDINHFLIQCSSFRSIRNKYNINNLEIEKLMNRDVKDINIEKYLVNCLGNVLDSDLGFIQALYIEHLPFLSVIYFHIELECRFKGDTPQVLYPVSCIKILVLLNAPKIMSANPRYKTILILLLHLR